MIKEIVKAIYDIAHANGVTVDVAADMFKHNVKMKENINKGSDFDFTQNVDADTVEQALDFADKHYEDIVQARTDGTFDKLFTKQEG